MFDGQLQIKNNSLTRNLLVFCFDCILPHMYKSLPSEYLIQYFVDFPECVTYLCVNVSFLFIYF